MARPPGHHHTVNVDSAEALAGTRTPPLQQVVYLHLPGLGCLFKGPSQGCLNGTVQVGEDREEGKAVIQPVSS